MTPVQPTCSTATDRSFRGAREAVLVDGASQFRPLPADGPRRDYLHGDLVGEGPLALGEGRSPADLHGRFVLAIHDPERRSLTICNDRHGFVPFYRATRADRLYFSTRIRPLVERGIASGEPDWATLADLLAFQMPLGTRTLVTGVSCVDAATSLEIDLDRLAVKERREWDPARLLREPRLSLAEAGDDLLRRFLDATARCLEDAAAVAVTLSGGLDTRCLLAAALELGRRPTAYHVGVVGSRAERYARRIAEAAGIPLHACLLDGGFATKYLGLLSRVVDATDGMKFAPQPEMLWLRDQVAPAERVLHGAFGELAKLGELRDFRLDPAAERAGRRELPDLLWRRFAPAFQANLRVFSPDLRAELEPHPRQHLHDLLAGFDADLSVVEVLQLAYLGAFVRGARYGQRLWNDRVATRFPFIEPRYVDLLLRLRDEDRRAGTVQRAFLAKLSPRLYRLPDENTGTRLDAPVLVRRLVRAADVARIALFDSKATAHHVDLLAWIHGMDPTPEDLVAQWGDAALYDREALQAMVRVVREACSRSAPLRAASRRRAHRAALSLQAFFMTELWRRSLGKAVRD
jgi:asparagine synthase (glutamine-hydrolysing)